MNKAVNGRICTPERMVLLYPIFREINAEMDEINAETERDKRRLERRKTKEARK